ncbi:hypothetical protein SSP35_05_03400 [Streptomyces sp. NBRC 110611]|uniref:hypothetical protein n=1 Tax=Streptomyces sp. NBRC 110611 TaxID=1621259 RepID=UPI000836D3E3|nr:hypothetical protein [Streptomyces sp. NBRC 110611]GAU67773.1 hypothetical protein SSP35_05_03400 [Streptomyces sp. NBRC 110611]
MPRRSFVPGAAVVATAALAAALTGCTSGSDGDGAGPDAKGGGTTTASQAAEPGRYQTLKEPCGLPSRSTLRGMLPGDDQQPSSADSERVYGGQAEITYDTDRRVGCHWTRETGAGTRHLTLDIQRVVSYDPKVSDDDKAQKIYDGKELAAKIPAGGGTGTGPASPAASTTPPATEKGKDADSGAAQGAAPQGGATDGEGGKPGADGKDGDGGAGGDASGKTGQDSKADQDGKAGQDGKDGKDGKTGASASGAPSKAAGPAADPGASTAPRVLDDLGDAAFLNDKLVTADSGVHRDITVVFRTSNVIVTITYDQWSTDKSTLPNSQELQDKARSLAGELADSLSE